MIERLGQRTYTQKVFDLPDGKTLRRCHIGHVHFQGVSGLEDVDISFTDAGTHWEVTKASYRLQVRKQFDAANLLRWQNRYDGATHDLVYEPHSLRWLTSASIDGATVFRTQQAVTGTLVSPTLIRFVGAFGPGLDYEIQLRRSGFTKELVIRARADLNPIPQGASLGIVSRYTTSTPMTINGQSADTDDNESGVVLASADGKTTVVAPAYAEDAADRIVKLRVVWQERAGVKWQVKVLPRPLLTGATYPLRADTVTQFYAGAGDGYVEDESTATWATARSNATGVGAFPTAATTRVGTGIFGASNFFNIRRTFFPCDTSGIPDTDTVSAATFYGYGSSVNGNGDDDGDDWFNIVGPTSQASNTTLALEDYDQCGGTSPTEWSSGRIDYSSISIVAYNAWALNAAGVSAVSKTGYTLIGMREGHDVLDSAYAGAAGTNNGIRFHTSEATGTGNDPYLEVTHAAASAVRALAALGVG